MSAKDDAVAAGLAAVQAGETQVLSTELGNAFDKGEAIGTGPGFTQADIDAAVKAAVDPLNAQVATLTAQDASDIKAGQDALAALQATLDTLSAKESVEASTIASLQGAKDQLAAVLAALNNIGAPAPVTP